MGKWYEEAVFYHIYPLGLCNAPRINEEGIPVNRLKELDKWVDHIKEMGFTALYIGPLFESEGHGYETRDYKTVDKRLGTNEDFKDFVKKCHSNGIKVVVDGVFNHTGREFYAFKDIRENREKSKYINWYQNVNFQGNNEYNDGFSYESWRGYNSLAKLNLRNIDVRKYLLEVIEFWVQEFDIDGIRLDCADVLDFDFMKEMRQLSNRIKDDFWLMGEVIHGDYSRWVNKDMLHSVTNYELHKGIYSGHNEHNYFEIAHTIRRLFDKNGGICKGEMLYTFVDNHDVERIATKLKNREHLYPVHMLLYTLPGIPSVYYGSEFGIEGKKENGSDYSLRPHLVLEDCSNNNPEFTSYLKKLGSLYKERKELALGEYVELYLTNRQYAFARISEEGRSLIVLNNDDSENILCVPVPFEKEEFKNLITGEVVKVVEGKIKITVPANRAYIFA